MHLLDSVVASGMFRTYSAKGEQAKRVFRMLFRRDTALWFLVVLA